MEAESTFRGGQACPPSDMELRSDAGNVGCFGLAAVLIGLFAGCGQKAPHDAPELLDHTAREFGIYWPPFDPEERDVVPRNPLLQGKLTLDVVKESTDEAQVRLVITIMRSSTEARREAWNSTLAFADIDWMDQVRVWDADEKWLWPNLPFLLRLSGKERVERYGGMDPGKHVDNDLVATAVARFCRLRHLPIVTCVGLFWVFAETRSGLQGRTLKCVDNVSMSIHRSPNDDYRD